MPPAPLLLLSELALVLGLSLDPVVLFNSCLCGTLKIPLPEEPKSSTSPPMADTSVPTREGPSTGVGGVLVRNAGRFGPGVLLARRWDLALATLLLRELGAGILL